MPLTRFSGPFPRAILPRRTATEPPGRERWNRGQHAYRPAPDQAHSQHAETLLTTGALQSAIFNSANFSSIATDAKGVIQIFNVGAERMLGYSAAEVMTRSPRRTSPTRKKSSLAPKR